MKGAELEIRGSIIALPTRPVHEREVDPSHIAPRPETTDPTLVERSTPRPVATPERAEALFARRHRQQNLAQDEIDQRARQALNAYQSLDQINERDYVSAVLGIDEYA
ncbi:hypothetical protein Rifp1Sym_bb00170 [endosymbiont of Riftia pachyptila (vent Ph05)]|uniref:Uncharacterized protein n=1 Tax=endosymbiont of Riftia pachyptila (vent Ph05) TaxID=1048808 RepID=G2DCG5_9GAMM|nr:hypothetical protein Rifp1Sym_bb00170 [endosymbiont of Riftia pachyptila (vent Ph05)]